MFQSTDSTPDFDDHDSESVFQNEFAAHLFDVVTSTEEDPAAMRQQSDDLMDAFLDFGTETEDNLNAWRKIEYGAASETLAEDTITTYGLKLKDKDVLISTVANALEALKLSDLPPHVREFIPAELTDSEWDAVTRIMTMTLIALERSPGAVEDDESGDEVTDA